MSNIRLENLTVVFQNTKSEGLVYALNNISTSFEHGKISVILGASGSGKTTLLNAIIGNLGINGKIYFNELDANKISIKEKNMSYVSQDYSLYPHLTVFDNIAFPLTMLGSNKQEIERRVLEIAKALDIELLLTRLPKQLSIGQRQKVAIARALVKRSDIYLFDEPFSNLDKAKIEELRTELKQILKMYGATTIFVTHDANDAYLLGDNVYVIENGEIVFKGTPNDMALNQDPNLAPYFKVEE